MIQESDKPGKLDVEKAKKLGVKPGPDLGILKSGKSVIAVCTGQEIKVTIMCRNDVLSWAMSWVGFLLTDSVLHESKQNGNDINFEIGFGYFLPKKLHSF